MSRVLNCRTNEGSEGHLYASHTEGYQKVASLVLMLILQISLALTSVSATTFPFDSFCLTLVSVLPSVISTTYLIAIFSRMLVSVLHPIS